MKVSILSYAATIVTLTVLAAPIHADVYRCERDGKTVYTDKPCNEGAKKLENISSNDTPDQKLRAEEANNRMRTANTELNTRLGERAALANKAAENDRSNNKKGSPTDGKAKNSNEKSKPFHESEAIKHESNPNLKSGMGK